MVDGGGLVSFIVTATDAVGSTARKTVAVKRNVAPVATGSINLMIMVGTQAAENDDDATKTDRPMLNQYRREIMSALTNGPHFSDADFEKLTFEAESSNDSVATASDDGKVYRCHWCYWNRYRRGYGYTGASNDHREGN